MKNPVHADVPQTMQACAIGPQRFAALEGRENHWMERKLDGFRGVVVVGPDHVPEMFSRARKMVGKYEAGLEEMCPHIYATLADLKLPVGTVLDGEMSTVDDDFDHVARVMKSLPTRARQLQGIEGLDVFGDVAKPLQYRAFDVLFNGADDLRPRALEQRRAKLEDLLTWLAPFDVGGTTSPVRWTSTYPVSQALLDAFLDEGAEGAMIKRMSSPYVSGKRPTDHWWKWKVKFTSDVVIVGFTDGREGKGVRRMTDTIGAIKYGQYRDGVLVRRGQCSGMDDAIRFGILDKANGIDTREEHIGKVIEISHRGIQNPAFRHPQFERFRDNDKPPEECEWETKSLLSASS